MIVMLSKFVFITSPTGAFEIAKYCDAYDSVCLSLCLSVRKYIFGTTRAIFGAYIRGSVLLRHVDDRPHRLSAGRRSRECTARAKCNLGLLCCLLS